MMRHHAGWLVALAIAFVAWPNAAQAGQYHAYLCNTPAGHAAKIPQLSYSNQGTDIVASDYCGDGNGSGVVLGSGSLGRVPGDYVKFELPAAPGTSFALAELRRRVLIKPGTDASAVPEYVLYRDAAAYDDAHILERCAPFYGCSSIDWPSGSLTRQTLGAATKLLWELRCGGGGSGASCGGTTPGDQRALVEMQSFHLVVNDGSEPTGTVSSVETQSNYGPVSVRLSAADTGGGVYQAYATLDGVEAGRVTTGGSVTTATCVDRGNDPTTDLDFEALAPCPAAADLKVPVNPAVVPNGTHVMRTYVRDAAGNVSQVDNRLVTTAAFPSAAICPAATLTLAGKARTATIKSGARKVIFGRLAGGGCESGVQVSEQLLAKGATWSAPTKLLPAPGGNFAYTLPDTSAGRRVRFTYTYGSPATVVTQTYKVLVAAAMTARGPRRAISPRAKIGLTGKVRAADLPATGLYVSIQVRSGNTWQTIDDARVRASGSWRWSYRLARAKYSSYRFRAHLRGGALPGVEPSSSPSVVVRVRR